MKTMNLLNAGETPEDFSYPAQFNRLVQVGMVDIEPWYIIEGDELRSTLNGLAMRYPNRKLVPFARRQDNDDIACWENSDKDVYVIHDFASSGWEQRAHFREFYDWLRQAFCDFIEFDS